MSGTVAGLARREKSRLPMEEVAVAMLRPDVGFLGDCKGLRFPDRQVTVIAAEDWQAALLDLAGPAGPPALPWTARRANVLVEGLKLPRGKGSVLSLGDCLLEVTAETNPCSRMEEAWPGLREALAPGWRGGVTCKVLMGGPVSIGDAARIVKAAPERKRIALP